MEEQLISYETAKLTKEKGFVEETADYFSKDVGNSRTFSDTYNLPNYHNNYDNRFSAPTQSLLQKWLREVHGLVVESKISKTYFWYDWVITYKRKDIDRIVSVGDPYQESHETYEQALEVGLLEALKLIKTDE